MELSICVRILKRRVDISALVSCLHNMACIGKIIVGVYFQNQMLKANKKDLLQIAIGLFGAGGRGRTDTVLLPQDFESCTSANSITPAKGYLDIISQVGI